MRLSAGRIGRRCSASLVCLLASYGSFAQNPAQAPPYRVSTHLVQIGVIVRNKNGPVTELTKNDFVILDRGNPQTISVSVLSRKLRFGHHQLL
jgi:hypothetical protein